MELKLEVLWTDVAEYFGVQDYPDTSYSVQRKIEESEKASAGVLLTRSLHQDNKDFDYGKDHIHIENAITLTSNKLAKTAKNHKELFVFLAAAGPELEHQVKKISNRNQLSRDCILDTMG